MMPTMTGMDFHRELAILDPDLASKMVFLSGGAFTACARELLDSVPNRRLEKPVGIDALRAAIDAMLVLAAPDDKTAS